MNLYTSLPVFIGSLSVEIIKLIIIMSGIFNFSLKKEKKNCFICLGAAVLMVLGLYKLNFMNAATLPMATVVLTVMLTDGKKKILYTVLSEVTASCADEGINYVVCRVASLKYGDYYLINSSISIIIFSLLAYIFQSRRKRGFNHSLKRINVFYLFMLVLSQLVIMYYINDVRNKIGFKKILMFVVMIAVFLVEIVLIYTLNRRDYYYNMSMMNQRIIDIQEQYYMKQLDHENEIKSFRHDVKNHLVCIDALISEGKDSEASEYISGLMGSFALTSPEIRTGNTIVSAIASDYASRFPEAELEWDGLIPDELKISRVDVCTIFSNVLSNAFENAVKSETEKKVRVMIHTVNNSMIITVRNNVGCRAVEKDGLFETSKEDKANHGLGTQNIKSCVKSNGGEVDFKFDEKMFEVKIILPNALQVF